MSFEIIKRDTNFDFFGARKYAYAVSAVLLLICIASLLIKGGPQYGIDFSGGINVQVKFSEVTPLDKIRTALDAPSLAGVIVQDFGDAAKSEVLLRIPYKDQPSAEIRDAVNQGLSQNFTDQTYEIQRLEIVGPKVGADLREKALQAIFYAVLLMATYISGRFEQKWMVAGLMAAGLASVVYVLDFFNASMSLSVVVATIATLVLCVVLRLKYALGAIVGLLHDVMFPLGLFSLLNKDVDLTIIAALLTIVGYSLNDSIIIFDRIRENLKGKTSVDFEKVINTSINQTLTRTVITAGTTILVVLALYLFGGSVIHDFTLVMLVGIIAGTYSSIFVATPVLALFKPKIEGDHKAAAAAVA